MTTGTAPRQDRHSNGDGSHSNKTTNCATGPGASSTQAANLVQVHPLSIHEGPNSNSETHAKYEFEIVTADKWKKAWDAYKTSNENFGTAIDNGAQKFTRLCNCNEEYLYMGDIDENLIAISFSFPSTSQNGPQNDVTGRAASPEFVDKRLDIIKEAIEITPASGRVGRTIKIWSETRSSDKSMFSQGLITRPYLIAGATVTVLNSKDYYLVDMAVAFANIIHEAIKCDISSRKTKTSDTCDDVPSRKTKTSDNKWQISKPKRRNG